VRGRSVSLCTESRELRLAIAGGGYDFDGKGSKISDRGLLNNYGDGTEYNTTPALSKQSLQERRCSNSKTAGR
jgi:hypothetical protein